MDFKSSLLSWTQVKLKCKWLESIIYLGGIVVIRQHSQNIIDYLGQFNNQSVDLVSQKFNISKKRLWYEISLLNDALDACDLKLLEFNQGTIIVPESFEEDSKIIIEFLNTREVITPINRTYTIAVCLFIKQGWVSVKHFEDLLNLSKNSILNELKIFKELASHYQVQLLNNRKEGYYLSGEEASIRRLCEYAMSQLTSAEYGLGILKEIFASWDLTYNRDDVVTIVEEACEAYKASFVPERYDDFINILLLLKVQRDHNPLTYSEETVDYIKGQPFYELGKTIAHELGIRNSNEGVFTTVRLLGALQGSQFLKNDPNLAVISKEIVARVKALTMASFSSISTLTLEKNLYEHLVPCYFRVKFDIPTINPFTEMIKKKYLDLFLLIKRCLEPFESYVGKKLTDDELSYFTIHFGGQLRNESPSRTSLKVITVCPNGISSSLVLDSQLKAIFPSFNFLGIHTVAELDTLDENSYDAIFSTVNVSTNKPTFVVRPIMNDREKDILRRQVRLAFNLEDTDVNIDIAKILSVVSKHGTIHDETQLYEDLYELIYKDKIKKEGLNLDELLKNHLIQYTDQELDWKAGIRLAAQPLLEKGYIEERYIDAMIGKVMEIGPYIVIAPKVAIPHARPEDGAVKMGISLLHSKQPIKFDFEDGEGGDVHLMFVLSGTDNTSHLTALQQLAALLEDEEDIDYMVGESDQSVLYKFIQDRVERMEV